jgi:hypothetical protein
MDGHIFHVYFGLHSVAVNAFKLLTTWTKLVNMKVYNGSSHLIELFI